jgi:hypothetical protein
MLKWVRTQATVLQAKKFKDDLKRTLYVTVGLRPGDPERYSRDNGGIVAGDPIAVIEHSRTPLQKEWWNSAVVAGGVAKLVDDPDPAIRSVTLAKVFHHWCNSKMQFPWWIYCVVFEKEVVKRQDDFRLTEGPMLICQLGEWNMYYRDKIYRTITAERAIVLWVITFVHHFECEFSDPGCRKYKLVEVKQLLAAWNGGKLVGDDEEDDERDKMEEDIMGGGGAPNAGETDPMEAEDPVFYEMLEDS